MGNFLVDILVTLGEGYTATKAIKILFCSQYKEPLNQWLQKWVSICPQAYFRTDYILEEFCWKYVF